MISHSRYLFPSLLPAAASVLLPLAGQASYFDLVPESKDDLECVTYDARYPYWTQAIYIATYPHHSRSKERWGCEYYGGVQLNSSEKSTHLLWSTWGVTGRDAPASGIDFVHAGPHMGWHRSTWEGSSGGVSGMWPSDEFKVNQWYRFVHRVWTPTDHAPHVGYAGVWMKSLETGEWRHMATFKFPAELTGFNNMQGFMEWFGASAPEKAAAEFRNCYAFCSGQWTSRTNFTANNAGGNTITLAAGENGNGVLMETTANPADPATGKRKTGPVVHQNFALRQPGQPDFFDAAKIEKPTAEYLGKQVVVRWSVDVKSAPQLGYDIDVFDGDNRAASSSWNDPEARECGLALPAAPAGKVSVRIVLRDIFNQRSPGVLLAATPSRPLAPAQVSGLAPGLAYRYFESPKPDTWSALPDFASLKPLRTGITAAPDITPRLRRNGYAFGFDGYLRIPVDGLYTFNLVAASGVRLAVDNTVIIDADGDRSIARYPGTAALKAGFHPVCVSFYHGKGRRNQADDFLQMTWSSPGLGTTTVPAYAFAHAAGASEPAPSVQARLADGVRLELSSRLAGFAGKIKRIDYYAVNDHFDYFSQQGAQSENYFLGGTEQPAQTVSAPIWGGEAKAVFARAITDDNRTVDSKPVVVRQTAPAVVTDANGMTLTELEHHLYPMNRAVASGTVTLVGDSMGLLTRPHTGDVTIIAHLAGITSDRALADGTRLESAGNWYSGIILRDSLAPRPGEPLGGAQIPYIALMGSADGATRHCDSTMINGAGNQPSGDIGRDCKWFKLVRRGQELSASISKDGKVWKQVAAITQPKMKAEIEVGFVHYSLPCAVPCVHWAQFDHLSVTGKAD